MMPRFRTVFIVGMALLGVSQVIMLNLPQIVQTQISDFFFHLSYSASIIANGRVLVATPNDHMYFPSAYVLGALFNDVTSGNLLYGSVVIYATAVLLYSFVLFRLFRSLTGSPLLSMAAVSFGLITNTAEVWYPSPEALSILFLSTFLLLIWEKRFNLALISFFILLTADPLYSILGVFIATYLVFIRKLSGSPAFQVPIRFVVQLGLLQLAYLAFVGTFVVSGTSGLLLNLSSLFSSTVGFLTAGATTNLSVSSAILPWSLFALAGEVLVQPVYYIIGLLAGLYLVAQLSSLLLRRKSAGTDLAVVCGIVVIGALPLLVFPPAPGFDLRGRYLGVVYPFLVPSAIALLSKVRFKNSVSPKKLAVTALLVLGLLWMPYLSIRVAYQSSTGTNIYDVSAAAFVVNHGMANSLAYNPTFEAAYSYLSHSDYSAVISSIGLSGLAISTCPDIMSCISKAIIFDDGTALTVNLA